MESAPRPFSRRSPQTVRREGIERWLVGETLAGQRQSSQLSLRDLSEKTKEKDPENKGVSQARIHRIERNAAIPDLRELNLLCKALSIELASIVEPEPKPWFLVRNARIDALLGDPETGGRRFHRIRGAHEYMTEEKRLYRYAPLDDESDIVQPLERDGNLRSVMRKVLFEVAFADEETMVRGLDSHEGEEIVYVLRGRLEFYLEQPASDHPIALVLEPGDCLHYSSELKHSYRSSQEGSVARALFVYVEPKSPTGPQFVPEHVK